MNVKKEGANSYEKENVGNGNELNDGCRNRLPYFGVGIQAAAAVS